MQRNLNGKQKYHCNFNFIVQEFSGFFKPGMNCTFSGLVSIFFLCGWGGEIRSNKKRQLLVSPLLRTVRVPFRTYGSSILIRTKIKL